MSSRWLLLKEWERLNAHSKLDLLKRVQGALLDALWLQQSPTRLALATFYILVALLTGFGALQEFIVRGIRDRQMQPFFISVMAMIVSILFITSGIALLRRWSSVRRLITLTGALSILLHVYGVLPPHRKMGFFVLIVGAGYGLVMLVVFEWNTKRKPGFVSQHEEVRMVVAVLNILIGLLLGFGAAQESIVLGLADRRVQPFFAGLAGIVVSVLFITSGIAMWRKWPSARRLVIITAVLSIFFHIYAALPPHRNVGPPTLIIGVGYGLVLLIITLSKGNKAEAAIS